MFHGPYHFDVARPPTCPVCRQPLLPQAVKFRDSIAYCTTCIDTTEETLLAKTAGTLANPDMHGYWTDARGLHFFTPPPYLPKYVACHLLIPEYADSGG